MSSGYKYTGTSYHANTVYLDPAGTIAATFSTSSAANAHTETFSSPSLSFDITPRYAETIVAGSINFMLGGKRYFDKNGRLYCDLDVVTGSATSAGSINYSTGKVTITTWNSGQSPDITLTSLLTQSGDNEMSGATFRIPSSPVRVGSFQLLATLVSGTTVNITADSNGDLAGTWTRGAIDYDSGVVGVEFGQMVTAAGNENEGWYLASNVVGTQVWKPAMVLADTIRYNAVAYSYLPLDADQLGLDPVRLPQDGKVPIFRKGGNVVIGNTQTSTARTVANGTVYNAGRVRLSRIRVIDAGGNTISTGYTTDLEAGTVTFTNVSGYSQPVKIEDRIEDLLLVSDVQISGELAFTRKVTHAYPVGSQVSSALIAGDLTSYVDNLFDQGSWDGTTWSDTAATGALAEYNDTQYPVKVENYGAITERWCIRFTATTAYQVIGENVGVIATGNTSTDCSPINPATNTPYFTIYALGFGSGWAVGNIIRFNTTGAQYPVWVVRTVQQGAETVLDDTFSLLIRGDVDRTV